MTETQDRFRENPWAHAADEQLGTRLDGLGAVYGGCCVTDDGTREMCWTLPRSMAHSPRRRRVLLARALYGDTDRWELVYREGRDTPHTVQHYASTSTRCTHGELDQRAGDLIEAGLCHVRRATASCGHVIPRDPRVVPGVAVMVTGMLLVLTVVLSWPAVLLWYLVPGLVGAIGWLAVHRALVARGIRA